MSNTAVILQYYDDTIMGKKIIKKKNPWSLPSKSFWSWKGRLLYSSLAGIKKNSVDATSRKTQQQ